MTDKSGQIVWEGEFLPFGEPLSITGTITNNLRFPGQYYDEETGLHYNYFRNYKPEVGRYIEADPILQPMLNLQTSESGCSKTRITWHVLSLISKPQNLHIYAFVGNNPINYTDPTGLRICNTICTLIPVPWWAAPICNLICPTELPEPILCILLTSAISGDSKICYYDCEVSAGVYHIGTLTIDKCNNCPYYAPFDIRWGDFPVLFNGRKSFR
jgi:RHS repeat-associated protein